MAKLGRPTTPLISQENAIQAALEVIDEHGLEALSLERVAKRIGVRAPSLYHHFHNKAELLTAVTRSILKDVEILGDNSASWEQQLLDLCLATRRAVLRHPKAGLLMLQYFPRTLLLGAYNFWAAKCPYPVELRLLILEGTEKLTFGSAIFAAAAAAYTTPTMPEFPSKQFPALARAVDSNPYDEEQLFAETVKIFLAGLAALHGTPAIKSKSAAKKVAAKAVSPKRAAGKAKVTSATKATGKSKASSKKTA